MRCVVVRRSYYIVVKEKTFFVILTYIGYPKALKLHIFICVLFRKKCLFFQMRVGRSVKTQLSKERNLLVRRWRHVSAVLGPFFPLGPVCIFIFFLSFFLSFSDLFCLLLSVLLLHLITFNKTHTHTHTHTHGKASLDEGSALYLHTTQHPEQPDRSAQPVTGEQYVVRDAVLCCLWTCEMWWLCTAKTGQNAEALLKTYRLVYLWKRTLHDSFIL